MKLTTAQAKAVLKKLNFRDGLIAAVVRDARTKDVLMVAYQNRRAALRTLTGGKMCYWSRSRKKLWVKGEVSGHCQALKRAMVDCDGDALLFDVSQKGDACHDGYHSCFYREVKRGKVARVLKQKFKPKDVYG